MWPGSFGCRAFLWHAALSATRNGRLMLFCQNPHMGSFVHSGGDANGSVQHSVVAGLGRLGHSE
jgi:hypothetical protein